MTRPLPTLAPFVLAAALLGTAPAAGQSLSGKLAYVAVTPCRVIDTRTSSSGILVAGAARAFDIVGNHDFSAQGGSVDGCSVPGYAGGASRTRAVAVNLTAVTPVGKGHLRAWAGDGAEPAASVLNYNVIGAGGTNLANMLILPLAQDAIEGDDLLVRAHFADVHLVADIVGYFTSASTTYLLTPQAHPGHQVLDACPQGFHVASLAELRDTTHLVYDHDLGYNPSKDMGAGPPFDTGGWLHTGFSSHTTNSAGRANCAQWSSNSAAHYGTYVALDSSWSSPAMVSSPYFAATAQCSASLRVWCIED